MPYWINENQCISCGKCARVCPVQCISPVEGSEAGSAAAEDHGAGSHPGAGGHPGGSQHGGHHHYGHHGHHGGGGHWKHHGHHGHHGEHGGPGDGHVAGSDGTEEDKPEVAPADGADAAK